ncbi:MAG: glycyl-radical enzyme activating protein [Candidatus Bathyarchaeota archaeon]|nr:glycyl-radical enzyme activating protein [Candidatus Bathyarchaeota archaeon]
MDRESKEGMIFDIQRYAIHDGCGIRTLVFLKGCPLRCLWCQNPEGLALKKQLMYFSKKCNNCGRCELVCPIGAIKRDDSRLKIDWNICTACGKCSETCYSQALRIVGKRVTTREVMKVIERDLGFYKNTGGGVTISGGEPLLQSEFTLDLLKECKKNYIHTAIETCGLGKWENLKRMFPYLDLIFYDIKIIDSQKHQKATSKGNELILDNLEKLSKIKVPLLIRIPVIPGFNDTKSEITIIINFIKEKLGNVKKVELLPYHSLGESKYNALGFKYSLEGVKSLSEEEIKPLSKIVKDCGFNG